MSLLFNQTAESCLENAIKTENGELLSGLWYIGVIMSIFASCASNLGVNIQKLSMMREFRKVKTIEGYIEKPYIKQRLWLVGLLLVIVGAAGDFAALGFAAQTLATPVGGLTMVANVYFAHKCLKEHLTFRDVAATGFVLVGVVLVAVSADKTEKEYSLNCLLRLYQRPMFIIYIVFIIFTMITLFILAIRLSKLREESPKSAEYLRWKKFHPVCPAALSGIVGSQSVLFAKCTAEMFKVTFEGNNQFNRWETYAIICGMIITIFNQLHWLAHGLRIFDAVLIIPIFQCFFIAGGVVGGAVFFDEFGNLESWEIITLISGVLATIIGVFLLSQRDHEHPGSDPKVTPNSPIIELHKRMSLSKPEQIPEDENHSTLDSTLKADQPMPMSLQFQSLVINDVFNAIRVGLSTPETTKRRPSSGKPRRGTVFHDRVVPEELAVNLKRHHSEPDEMYAKTFPVKTKSQRLVTVSPDSKTEETLTCDTAEGGETGEVKSSD